jgi:trehalose/maltose hydrolase-like predicted phosphorylase
MGVMAGTLDLVQWCHAGMRIRDGVLAFDPRLPDQLDELSFSMQFRRTPLEITLTRGELTLAAHAEGGSRPITVAVGDDIRELSAGERTSFTLPAAQRVGQQDIQA